MFGWTACGKTDERVLCKNLHRRYADTDARMTRGFLNVRNRRGQPEDRFRGWGIGKGRGGEGVERDRRIHFDFHRRERKQQDEEEISHSEKGRGETDEERINSEVFGSEEAENVLFATSWRTKKQCLSPSAPGDYRGVRKSERNQASLTDG